MAAPLTVSFWKCILLLSIISLAGCDLYVGAGVGPVKVRLSLDPLTGEVAVQGGIERNFEMKFAFGIMELTTGIDATLPLLYEKSGYLYILSYDDHGNLFRESYNIGQTFEIEFPENTALRHIQGANGSVLVYVDRFASLTSQSVALVANTPVVPAQPASPPPTRVILPTRTSLPSTVIPTQVAVFTVLSSSYRNDTGLYIRQGQVVTVDYISGQWRAGPLPTWPLHGPEGDPQTPDKRTFPVPDAPIMSLVVGVGNRVVDIVGRHRSFTSPTSGTLWFGANDDDFTDNVGSLIVQVTYSQ